MASLPWDFDFARVDSQQSKSSSSIGSTSQIASSPASPAVAKTTTTSSSTSSSSLPTTAPNIHLLTDLRYKYTCTAIRSRYHPYDDDDFVNSSRRRGWRQPHQHYHPRLSRCDPPTRVVVDENGEEREIPSSNVRVVGFTRRRRGRGGRENLDRSLTTSSLEETTGGGLWDRVSMSLMNNAENELDEKLEAGIDVTTTSGRSCPTTTTPNRFANGLPRLKELSTMEAHDW